MTTFWIDSSKVIEGKTLHSNATSKAGKNADIVTKSTNDFKNYVSLGYTYVSFASDLLFLKEGFQKIHELKKLGMAALQ